MAREPGPIYRTSIVKPNMFGYWTDRASKLEMLRDQYPENDEAFKWAFIAYSDETLGQIRDAGTNRESKLIWSGIPLHDILKRHQQDVDLCTGFLYKIGLKKPEDLDSPHAYDHWNIKMQDGWKYNTRNSSSCRHEKNIGSYAIYAEAHWRDQFHKRALYEQHRVALARIEAVKNLTVDQVFAGIESMKKGKAPSTKQKDIQRELAATNAPLEIQIPSVTDEHIAEHIASLTPNSFDDITKFAQDWQRDFSRAIQQISEYFILHSARPAKTLDRVEEIMQMNGAMQSADILPPMPRNAFDRVRGAYFWCALGFCRRHAIRANRRTRQRFA